MPTNLGALPSGQPPPNGRVQFKRGAADGTVLVSNLVAANTKLSDGAGGFMQITYTPTYPCLWVVSGNVMSRGDNYNALAWRRWDWGIRISPADADGVSLGFQCPSQNYWYANPVEWDTKSASCAFRLNAGVAYTAYLSHEYSEGDYQSYHTGPLWIRILGRAVGEGVA